MSAEPIICESHTAFRAGADFPCGRPATTVLIVQHKGEPFLLRVCQSCAGMFNLRRNCVLDQWPIDELASEAGTWLNMADAPTDGTVIEGYYGPNEIVRVRFAEDRVCMLAGIAPGAGQFGEGWEDEANGLYANDPLAWRPATGKEKNS